MKAVVVDAIKDLLPPETANGRKMGFEMPLGSWLNSYLCDRLLASIEMQPIRSIFASDFLRSLSGRSGDFRHTRLLWAFLLFAEWFNKFRCSLP